MAGKRKWGGISKRQRDRYATAGRTGKLSGQPGLTRDQVRRYYERGGDLGGGRGYHPPKGAAPRELIRRVQQMGPDYDATRDLKKLSTWRKSRTAPKWIPRNQEVMRDDTAALLSLVGSGPRNWKSVTITDEADGTHVMTVTTKRGATRIIILPDREAKREVAHLLRNGEAMATTPADRKRLAGEWRRANGEQWEIDVRIDDTDQLLDDPLERERQELAIAELEMRPKSSDAKVIQRRGTALPRKKGKKT